MMIAGREGAMVLLSVLLLLVVTTAVGQDASGDGSELEELFERCDCGGTSCPRQAADVAIVLDVTYSMQRYFSWVERLVAAVETGLIAKGMGSGSCHNLYSLTVFGMSGAGSCGQTLNNMEEKYVFADEFPDLMAEMRAVRARYGSSKCEDGWEATLVALKARRRSQQADQGCIQPLTVLISDEDRQECCGLSDIPDACCNKSSQVTRTSLIRQLRREGTEFVAIVDQYIFGDKQEQVHLMGARQEVTGRIGFLQDPDAASGFREVRVSHFHRGFVSTRLHYTKVPLKPQINGSAWCLRCSEEKNSGVLTAIAHVVPQECADCSKKRGGVPQVTTAPTMATPSFTTEQPITSPAGVCGPPPVVPNADLVSGPKAYPSPPMSVALWRCRRGYRSPRQQLQQCVISGDSFAWLPAEMPPCEPMTCPEYPRPANGLVFDSRNSTDHMTDGIVWLTCVRGYRLQGDGTYRCGPDGKWRSLRDLGTRCVPWNSSCSELEPELGPGKEINLSPPSSPKEANHTATRACVIFTVPETPPYSGFDPHAYLRGGAAVTNLEMDLSRSFSSHRFCLVGVGRLGKSDARAIGCSTDAGGFRRLVDELTTSGSDADVLSTLSDAISQQVCNDRLEVRVDIVFHRPSPDVHDVKDLATVANYRSSVVMMVTDSTIPLSGGGGVAFAMDQHGNYATLDSTSVRIEYGGEIGMSEVEQLAYKTGGWVLDGNVLASQLSPVEAWLSTTVATVLTDLADKICRRCWCGSLAPNLSCANLHMFSDEDCVFGRV